MPDHAKRITAVEPAEEALAWWREARFGMFIHWGLCSVHAGVWDGTNVRGLSEWLMAELRIPIAEYRKLAGRFNPLAFDAEAIVRLAIKAGMRYVVFVAKHHDGFALWDTKVSGYSIVRSTPFGRDPVKELAEACARHGMRLGIYYSQALDWEHPDGAGNDWDYKPEKKNFQRYLDDKVKPQLTELLTGYGPIAMLWFDTPVSITREQSVSLKRLVKRIQPDCLISGRIGHGVGDFGSLGDNQIPVGRLKNDWETPATMNDTWGYKSGDRHWKSTETILRLLIDLSSKGANYLLNIGPDAMGRVPEQSLERLLAIGAWIQQNGDAVYGTTANPFPYEFSWGRMTVKGRRLFLFLTDPSSNVLQLRGLRNTVLSMRLLATGDLLSFEQTHDRANESHLISLHIPDPLPPGVLAPAVIELELDDLPDADEGCIQQPDGSVSLAGHMATLHVSGESTARRVAVDPNKDFAAVKGEEVNDMMTGDHMRIGSGGLVENWRSEKDWLSWSFRIFTPGKFQISIHTVAAKYCAWVGGHTVRIRFLDRDLSSTIDDGTRVDKPRTHLFSERATLIGKLPIDEPGHYTLSLHADTMNPADPAGLCVDAIVLTPDIETDGSFIR